MTLPRLALAFIAITVAVASLSAQDRSYGRSVVITRNGIVATTYVQASQAGARIPSREVPPSTRPSQPTPSWESPNP